MVIDNNFTWNRNVYTFPSFCPRHPNSVDRYTLAPGLELWSDGITVTYNHFEYLTTTGIDGTAVLNLTVQNNMIRNTSRGIEEFSPSPEHDSPGIRIANCAPALGSGSDQMNASRPRIDMVTITGNSILNTGTIYQSYGVRLRRDTCVSPTVEDMSNISIQAVPIGNNRLGSVCRAKPIQGPNAPIAISECDEVSPQIGSSLPGGIVCGSSGCRVP